VTGLAAPAAAMLKFDLPILVAAALGTLPDAESPS
jgi:hypothetical protein